MEIRCEGCGARLRVADEYINRRAQCPSCNHVQRVCATENSERGPSQALSDGAPAHGQQRVLPDESDRESDSPSRTPILSSETTESGPAGIHETAADADTANSHRNAELAAQMNSATDVRELGVVEQAASSADIRTDSRRSHTRRHRGTLILILGVLGLMCSCAPFSIAAWVMASKDLQSMISGGMDPTGRELTRIGYYLGMGASMLWIIGSFCVTLTLLITSGS